MAKEGLESVHSSIALLHERFRQLQRAKEIREERELMRQMSESGKAGFPAAKHYYEPTGLFLQSQFYKPTPKTQGSMYLNPNLQSKQGNYFQVFDETPVLIANMCSSTVGVMERTNSFDDSDVDTSLHL